MAIAAGMRDVVGNLGKHRDLPLVFGVIGILFLILIPLPPTLMDMFLILNLTMSLLVLLTTLYVRTPLDFSAFPSLLLIVTLYRLALNIATTRLILGNAQAKEEAAGSVILAFGNFVAGTSPLVGFIIFIVIVVIQFVVVTKGATRVAEVAARFTLDKMPGQQLSIDADLNAGLIDEQTAKARRERISSEADFYGAMDGASKFVRGDAIAGIVITLINIVGGLIIGVTIAGMTFDQAVETFTLLTIGDGLVSQIPALIVSIAAGLLVTRSNTESNLGVDLLGQVLASPRALIVTGVFMLLLLPSPLPKWVLLSGASVCAGLAWLMTREKTMEAATEAAAAVEAEEQAAAETQGSSTVTLPPVDPLELEVGYGLVGLVDNRDGGGLLHRVGIIREQIAMELGLVIPAVRIRDNMQLNANDYAIKLRGEPIAVGTAEIDHFLAMDPGLGLEPMDGIPTKEPAFGIDAVWITEDNKGRAEAIGYTVVDVTSVLATHLTETIRDHASELLTREEVARLLDKLKEEAPSLVQEVVPDVLKAGEIQKVLQNLLKEKVSIRDQEAILECLADWAPKSRDPEILTEYVRNALGRSICRQYTGEGTALHVVTVDPKLEDYIQNATEHTDRGSFLRLSPEMLTPVVQVFSKAIEKLVAGGHPAIVLTAPQTRLQIRRMLENAIPGVVVLSYNEVVRGISVEALAVARLE
ncbi:MAG: flagellar biosynthesis protein FlhA [Planctomycetota bacterium]